MNIAIIGDTHAGARSSANHILNHMEKYFYQEFFPTLEKYDIDRLIHLGDLFDRRKYINYTTLHRWKTFFFSELQSRGIQMDIIPGNHDVAYKNTNELNSLDLLLEPYNNVVIHHQPTIINIDNRKIGLVPWVNKENYNECVSFIRDNANNVDWLGGHFDIQGVEMIRGVKSEDGFSQGFFRDYRQVLSGHYHTPSVNGNIWYPGSPYEFTWADYAQDKGFVMYNTKTDEFEKISTQDSMFYKVYYDDSNEFELKKKQSFFPTYKDKYVKVIVQNKNNTVKFDQFISNLYNHNPFDISIVESEVELGLSEDDMNIEMQSTIEVIESTIDNMSLNVPNEELKKLFYELYNEAMNNEV